MIVIASLAPRKARLPTVHASVYSTHAKRRERVKRRGLGRRRGGLQDSSSKTALPRWREVTFSFSGGIPRRWATASSSGAEKATTIPRAPCTTSAVPPPLRLKWTGKSRRRVS